MASARLSRSRISSSGSARDFAHAVNDANCRRITALASSCDCTVSSVATTSIHALTAPGFDIAFASFDIEFSTSTTTGSTRRSAGSAWITAATLPTTLT